MVGLGRRGHRLRLRVERVAQAVADEVDAEHREQDERARGSRAGARSTLVVALGVGEHVAPRRLRRLHAEAEEAQRRLGDDRAGDRQRHVHHDRPDAVREEVADDDPRVRRAGGSGRLDELLLLDASTWPRTTRAIAIQNRPASTSMITVSVPPNFLSAMARMAMLGHDQEQVGEAHEELVDPAAEEAGDGAAMVPTTVEMTRPRNRSSARSCPPCITRAK